MQYAFIGSKIPFIKKQPETVVLALIYRYLSLLITTVFFVMTQDGHSTIKNVFIITCIAVSCMISSYLYIRNRGSGAKIMILLLIETLGNSFLLIPSGGLNSPYVWYSLNTILTASLELKKRYCWLNLFIYAFVSTGASYFLSNRSSNHLTVILKQESSLFLSLVLITLAVQMLSKYMKKLQIERLKLIDTNDQLLAANKTIKESMSYIMELYQAVDLFSTQSRKSDLIKLIVHYTKKITKEDNVLFIGLSNNPDNTMIEADDSYADLEKKIKTRLLEIVSNDSDFQLPVLLNIGGKNFISALVRSNYRTYGVLMVELLRNAGIAGCEEVKYQLKFLADLGSIVLERFELEKINEDLLISEEQNRIANEIHDSVSQKLFSISCGVLGLMKNTSSGSDMNRQLNMLRGNVNDIIIDLRTAVYKLSWKKEGTNSFIADIVKYVNETKKLNHIEISLNTAGNYEILSPTHKKSLYRIICEGIGNAIRHGNANVIDVILHVEDGAALLEINDNGSGFNLEEIKRSNKFGMGIENICNLVQILKGKIDFRSIAGQGTGIKILIPAIDSGFYKEDAV